MISWTWHLIGAAIAFGGLNAFDAWRTRARITQSSSTIPPVGSVDRVRRVDNKRLQIDYVVVYALVMFADWLQGPYVFSLCESSETASTMPLLTGPIMHRSRRVWAADWDSCAVVRYRVRVSRLGIFICWSLVSGSSTAADLLS